MKKPNILFIMTDQQRADTIACYRKGESPVVAPNLNRLAEESTVFRNAYCTHPVCTPSRSSIITGQWPHTNGCIENNIALRDDAPGIGRSLEQDYHTAYYGKWHLGDEIRAQHGFTEWLSFEDNYRAYYSDREMLRERSDYHHYLVNLGYPPDKKAADGGMVFGRNWAAALPERHTKASYLGREAARFLRDYDEDKPFFLTVSFLEPHPPNFSEFSEQYDPDEVDTGEAFFRKPDKSAPNRLRLLAENFVVNGCRDHPSRTEADWRRIRANYYGLVTLVDRAIGVVLDALDASGKADETLVVFTSDHGEMAGDHALGKKDVFYEQASRIPFLIRAPWLGRKHRMVEGRVSLIDLVPTLLDFAGVPIPESMQGKSRKEVVEGTATLEGNDVFIEQDTSEELLFVPWRSIVSSDGWKMNLCLEDRGELYDLNTDPNEMRNLFEDPAQKNRVGELYRRLRQWQEETGDPVSLPELDG